MRHLVAQEHRATYAPVPSMPPTIALIRWPQWKGIQRCFLLP
ncbi:Uncharacterised protein [Vibrio cholerae]|nr:Uncharacterised protein [Vibrio cholerae]